MILLVYRFALTPLEKVFTCFQRPFLEFFSVELLSGAVKTRNLFQAIDLYEFIVNLSGESFRWLINWRRRLNFRLIIDQLLSVLMPKSPSNHGFLLTPIGLLFIMPA